ncbi:hypothetical protein EZI54_15345 [Marinobacter halodurans]|uniref:Uncharacterized protein n=1 Tax=Marinobacter halodurans TaxID=2528979 RepID=A0ABY1ZLP3_9GAMM|nr:hypothetical protein [Marinobacter halodurans]TBW53355.1 hypothetical protein EZI54_15345 [Marinobacter halodurans]
MTENYYGPQAYRSDRIPEQKRQVSDPGRSWFNRKFDMRLPWGQTEEVAPYQYMDDYSPKMMRDIESKPTGFENIDFHQRIDQERYRHATPALRTKLLFLLGGLGSPYLMAFIALPMLLVYAVDFSSRPGEMGFLEHLSSFLPFAGYIYAPLIGCWALPNLMFRFFPKWSIKPGKGPKWELNRRTGLVTVYQHSKKGSPEEEQAPFYEFDAYLTNEMIPPGQVVHTLYLVHRYRPILLPIGNLIGKTTGEECFALWDMFQNFMDTSRPLPDIPLWEEFRSKDPITAEHDRQTGRPARYWRDMDDETWKQKESEMMSKVRSLTTPHRPNLMRQHVRYVS